MRFKVIVLALVALVATSALATAQQLTGEIYGKVTDASGAVLPGVTVTLTGPVLLQPLTAVTSETGTYQFPRLSIGVYNVKFDLAGFKTVVNEGIRVTVGFNAQVNAQLGISTVQETVTVTGESPIVDTKEVGTKQTFTNELLQSIPSARDPWVILQQTAGIAMDRENIGGNMSGQQSNYVSRGGNPTNNKWSLDGVDITDLSATGASPSYYDFDAFEEMTINTGGVDVTQQTGGVGINLVTKSGTDRFKGSSRFYSTPDRFESQNVTDAQRGAGRDVGQPDSGHQGLRHRSRRPDQEGAARGSGAASASRSSTSASSASTSRPPACQAFRTTVGRAGRVDRGGQRLPEHRPDAAADHQPEGGRPAVQGQQADAVQQLREEGPQRARRRRPEPDRGDVASARGAELVRRQPVEHRAEPDLQDRRSVGPQRPAAARRAVGAHREQLHPRLPRGLARRRAADADHLDRPERPLGHAEREHPPGQQHQLQRELLPAGQGGRRPRVQVRRLLSRQLQRVAQLHRRPRDRALPDRAHQRLPGDLAGESEHADRVVPGAADARRPEHLRPEERVGVPAGHLYAQAPDDADGHPLRSQPRCGARRAGRREPDSPELAAGGGLRRRRPGDHLQQLLAAHRLHLRRQRQRQDPGPGEFRALLRTGGHRQHRVAAEPGRTRRSSASRGTTRTATSSSRRTRSPPASTACWRPAATTTRRIRPPSAR